LILAKKAKEEKETVFVNLCNQPRSSIEASSTAREILCKTPADLTATTGTCEIHTDSRKFGEMSKLSTRRSRHVSWALPVAFAQTDLCQIAFNFSQGDIFLPHLGKG
jgi:hypothetical protein